jgi:SulP family sulfate permease
LIVLFVAPLAAYLPVAAMAGVLLMVAYSLIDIPPSNHRCARAARKRGAHRHLHRHAARRAPVRDHIGVIVSLMLFLNRTSRPAIHDAIPAPGQSSYHCARSDEPECCQLKMLTIDGALYFGAVDHARAGVARNRRGQPFAQAC